MSEKVDKAKTSEKLTGIKIGQPKKVAGGIPAVLSSVAHISKETGVFKGLKVLSKMNQKQGFDCPGCAWPDPDDERSSLGEYCENGAKAISEEVTSKLLTPEFFRDHSVPALAQLSDYEIGKKGRIAQPMYLPAGASHYEAISWATAFDKIGTKLNSLASPNESVFYTSGRTSNEAAFLYQLFVRAYGTNNLPDCSNMCHESSGVALSETLGIGKGSVTLEDFYEAEVIVVMGQNPGTNHPRMLTALQKAKKNGANIVSVNPIKESGLLNFSHPQDLSALVGVSTKLTDQYLQVKVNGDLALLQAVNHLLVKKEEINPGTVLDQNFITSRTQGSKEYLQHIAQIDLDRCIADSGVSRQQIDQLVDLLAAKSKIIVCWAMGLTQHHNAVATIKEVVNLLLLKGSVGKPGAGTCPVRGHSNVQGDRTVGIVERPPKQLLEGIEREFHFTPPAEHGYDVVNSIKAMHDDKVKVFFAMGGNFISATPDTAYTGRALEKCDLTVHVSTKLNRSHLVHGKEALILPCISRTEKDVQAGKEQFVTVENSMGIVHSSQGILPPSSSELMSEPAIVCRLAMATLKESTINWDQYMSDYDSIRDSIESTIAGFDNYNVRVREPSGFYLPNVARAGTFRKDTGKAHFTVSENKTIQLKENEYLMMTVRSHDQFNTTIYGLDDRYRGIYNERRVVMMNPKDIRALGFVANDLVDLYNHTNDIERVAPKFVVVPYDIPRGTVATYFPEANVLVPISETAQYSNTPASKSVVVTLRKQKAQV